MQIEGFVKTTLLDYPGHLAATIFLKHCNFRCPYCHNKDLVLADNFTSQFSKEEILSYLKKRVGILEGICITGGEPTLSKDLIAFIMDIKKLSYKVKLDTNGYMPDVLEDLLKHNLLDYVAMDIKSSPRNYGEAAGIPNIDLFRIKRSVELLQASNILYEFRTTLVKELHTIEDMKQIREWLQGSRAYFLQPYKGSETVLCPGYSSHTREELAEFLNLCKDSFSIVSLRGVDA